MPAPSLLLGVWPAGPFPRTAIPETTVQGEKGDPPLLPATEDSEGPPRSEPLCVLKGSPLSSAHAALPQGRSPQCPLDPLHRDLSPLPGQPSPGQGLFKRSPSGVPSLARCYVWKHSLNRSISSAGP